jgi:methyl-accepting chemotaxis protein
MFDFGKNKESDYINILDALDRSQAVIHFKPDGTIITANANFLNALNYKLEDIVGKHHSLFVEKSERESQEYKEFWQELAQGKFQAREFKRIGKEGKEVWIEASYNPILDQRGKVYKVVKYATVITDKKLIAADLNGQIAAISKSQAIIEFDLKGNVLGANENFLSVLGYKLEEAKGKHHSIFVDPDHIKTSEYKEFWDRLAKGEYQAAQYKRITKSGEEVWIEASYNPIFDMNGKPYKVVKFATDITAQVDQLAALKELIEVNFAEIETALLNSSDQATAANDNALNTASNVETVAAASEELDSSVQEIANSMERSREAVAQVVEISKEADTSTQKLIEAANAMSGVVQLIQGIAEQINLLALNATIESARAGDAGKGFAVVANEVKNLANQAAKATSQITTEIEGVQTVSSGVFKALGTMRELIANVQEHVNTTASAVEEQSVVTREMSSNMQQASDNVQGISTGLHEITAGITQVGRAVEKTKEAASETLNRA